jgi:NADH-quinone oxidoreductase subunit E
VSFHPHIDYAIFHRSERKLGAPGEPFEYTPENRARFDELIARYPPAQKRSAVLPALHLVQAQLGYVTAASMRYVAGLLEITPADVEDVVSFYTMFYTKPVGRFVLQVCRTLSCALNGAGRVTEELSSKLGIAPGQTDDSGTFTLLEVECLGACDRAPVVMVNDAWHECLSPDRVSAFVDELRARGEAAVSGCHHVVERPQPEGRGPGAPAGARS